MEWRKVKNIIILVLLLVNGFLLILVGARRGEVRRYEQAALTRAIQVLANNGIQVKETGIISAEGLSAQSMERSAAGEERMVCALLGETVSGENRGGGLYIYQGGSGQVNFRGGGELTAVLGEDERWQTDDPEGHAADLLREMDVEAEQVQASLSDGTGVVIFRQLWDGAPLFSCQVEFTYEGGRLTRMAGSLLTTVETDGEEGQLLSLPTALLRFLDEVLDSGDVCSAILSMEPGYLTSQSFTSAVRLTPVWRVSGNTADYYLNAVTGELTRAPGD